MNIETLAARLSTKKVNQLVVHTPFLEQTQNNKEKCFKMHFRQQTIMGKQFMKQSLVQLKLQTEPFQCIYNMVVVERLTDFLQTQVVEESLKTKTRDKIEAIQDQTYSKVESLMENEIKIDLDVRLGNFVLILPFSNARLNECWVMKLGNLHLTTIQGLVPSCDCYELEVSTI